MKRYATIGFVIGLAIVAGQAVAAWTVQSQGEAGITLASLSAVNVTPVNIVDVFPGDKVTVKTKLSSKNARPLKVRAVTLAGVKAGACNVTLKSLRKTFVPADNLVVPVGDSEAVLGSFEIPSSLSEECQGESLTVALNLDLVYGGAA